MSMMPMPRHCLACNEQWMGNLDSSCPNCFPRVSALDGTNEEHAVNWHMNKDGLAKRGFITVAAGLVIKNGKILLSQRDDYHSDYHDRWQNPGGTVEPQEHPRDAVVRELKEETDMNVRVVKWICNTMVSKPTTLLLVMHYLCITNNEPKETIESLRPEWCDPIILKNGSRNLMSAMEAVKDQLYEATIEYISDIKWDGAGGDRIA